MSGIRSPALATLVVDDYDRAITWYSDVLGFRLTADAALGGGKRWVTLHVQNGSGLLLALGADDAQRAAIGNQTGGRVAFFLHTDDFARDHAAMLGKGVRFMEAPRQEPYGQVAVFADLCGNLWDLIEPAKGA